MTGSGQTAAKLDRNLRWSSCGPPRPRQSPRPGTGRGDKELVDQAAVDAMRPVLNTISMRGTVVIGEAEKDEAPMLYNGEEVGDGSGPEVDFAVDPVDGTTLTAKSLPNALAIVAVAERHTMFDPGPCVYMKKIACAADLSDVVDLTDPIETTLAHIAKARGVPVPELTVCILDRPRHEADLVRESGRWARASSSCSTATLPERLWPRTRTPTSTSWWASAGRPRVCWRRVP